MSPSELISTFNTEMLASLATGWASVFAGFSHHLSGCGIDPDRCVSVGRDAIILHNLGIATDHLPLSRAAFLPAGSEMSLDDSPTPQQMGMAEHVLRHLRDRVGANPILLDIGYQGTIGRILGVANARLGILNSISASLVFGNSQNLLASAWCPISRDVYRNVTAAEATIASHSPPVVGFDHTGPIHAVGLEEDEGRTIVVGAIQKKIVELFGEVGGFTSTEAHKFLKSIVCDPSMELVDLLSGWTHDDLVGGSLRRRRLIPQAWEPWATRFVDAPWLCGTQRFHLRRAVNAAVPEEARDNRYLLLDLTNTPGMIESFRSCDVGIIEDCTGCCTIVEQGPICLLTTIDAALLETQNPIIYVVDNRARLRNNDLWWRLRKQQANDLVLELPLTARAAPTSPISLKCEEDPIADQVPPHPAPL